MRRLLLATLTATALAFAGSASPAQASHFWVPCTHTSAWVWYASTGYSYYFLRHENYTSGHVHRVWRKAWSGYITEGWRYC